MVWWSRAAVHDHDNVDPGAPGTIPKIVFLLPYALLQRPDPRSAFSSTAQARQVVRVAALPCTREHRKIHFRQKNTYDLKDFFSCFCRTEPNALYLTMNYRLRDDHVFTILTPNWPNSTSGPRGASGIQLGHNLTQSGSNLTPIWVKLGPNSAQSIFTNSRSTAQADVML